MAERNLNNFDVTVQSWYIVCRSGQVRKNRVRTVEAMNRRLAVYRDSRGSVHTLDALCPHMGADLSLGKVEGSCLQCPLHKWEFSNEGALTAAPYEPTLPLRRVRSYQTIERYGYVWVFNGPVPLFEVPQVDASRFVQFTLPSQVFNNHPHFLTANGLDWRHLDTLHEMSFSRSSTWNQRGEYELIVEHLARPKSRFLQFITLSMRKPIRASFQTIGANLALIRVQDPEEFQLMFSSTPLNNHTTRTRVVIFLPRANPIRFTKAFFMYLFVTFFVLLYKDHKIFNTTHFIPGFTDQDEPFRTFANMINKLPRY